MINGIIITDKGHNVLLFMTFEKDRQRMH